MPALSLREAAHQVGTSKSTILRAVKRGRLSATRTDDGGYLIEPAELFRVYAPRTDETRSMTQHAPERDTADAVELRIRTAALEARIEALQAILEAERQRAEQERRRAEELRVERDRWHEQAQQSQRLLTQQARPGLWGRLMRRTS